MNINKEIGDIRIEDFAEHMKRYVSSLRLLSSFILLQNDALDVTNADFQGVGVILDSLVNNMNREIKEVVGSEEN